jgi:hypothetical protein
MSRINRANIGLAIVGIFSLFSLFGCATTTEGFALSDNLSESTNFEIRQLIRGKIDAVMYNPVSHFLLVGAKGMLWKIHPDGYVVDALRGYSGLRSTGIQLEHDSFSRGDQHFSYLILSDWFYTSDKSGQDVEQLPVEHIASELTGEPAIEALHARLERADIVEFFRVPESGERDAYRALLREQGRWIVLDLSGLDITPDDDCRELFRDDVIWQESCLAGFSHKPASTLVPFKNLLPYSSDLADKNLPLRITQFSKKSYYYEDGFSGWLLGKTLGKYLKSQGVPGALPESYWVGIGDLELDYRGENISFSAPITNKEGRYEMDNLSLYAFPEESDCSAGFIQIKGDKIIEETALNSRWKNANGLYAIRKKDCLPRSLDRRSALSGAWQLEFSDTWRPAKFLDYPSGNILFNDEADSAYFHERTEFVRQTYYSPPQSIDWLWPGYDSKTAAYAMFGNSGSEEPVWVNLRAGTPLFRLDLDEKAVADALAALGLEIEKHEPARLQIRLTPIRPAEGRVEVLLACDDREVPIKRFQFGLIDYQKPVKDVEPVTAPTAAAFAGAKLRVRRDDVLENPEHFSEYASMAEELVGQVDAPGDLGHYVTADMAEMFSNRVAQKDIAGARRIFDLYAQRFLPLFKMQRSQEESLDYNISVIASQGLVLSIYSSDQVVSQQVFDKLLGPDFDLYAQKNATLLYNLSCYYSLNGDKSRLIETAKRALALGKPVAQFEADSDFDRFREDPDFQRLLLTE